MSAAPATIAAPAVGRSVRPRAAAVIAVLSVVGALVLGYVGSNVWASIQQNHLATRFDSAAQKWATLDRAGRSNVTYTPGDPVARIVISSIGLDAIVAEGATPGIMRRAPGHLPGSATPGENGIAIITANRFGFGSFFMRLGRLGVGDKIEVQSALGRTTYSVVDVSVVPADQLDLSTDSTDRVLILFASDRLLGGADRLVVRALADQGTA